MNRRKLFSMLTGAIGALALPKSSVASAPSTWAPTPFPDPNPDGLGYYCEWHELSLDKQLQFIERLHITEIAKSRLKAKGLNEKDAADSNEAMQLYFEELDAERERVRQEFPRYKPHEVPTGERHVLVRWEDLTFDQKLKAVENMYATAWRVEAIQKAMPGVSA